MNDFWKETEDNVQNVKNKINKKKITILIAIVMCIILFITFFVIYVNNDVAREWIDKNVFRKEIMQNNTATIDLKEETSNIYAFNRYIGILDKTKFGIYSQYGNKETELDMQISNPIFDSANRFLAVAENEGQKFYIVEDKDIKLESSVNGNISQIHVNKNGYVAIVITGTIHKTVVAVYSPEGRELFKTYFSSTRAIDATISNDNKYLSVAEIDTSGTLIKSKIKIISIEKAKNDPTNSVENIYECENGKLITNIKYQDKGKLLCMYTDKLSVIDHGTETVLVNNNDKKVIFQSIELDNNIISIEEKSSGLFTANSNVSIINTDNKSIKSYGAEGVVKGIVVYGNRIALNLGTEIDFINTEGWLVKRYVSSQELTNIVMSDNLAGIVYRDKIEIVNL